jgi:two-component system chemotaxis sensor kinase CheA
LDRLLRHVAEGRGLKFSIELDPKLGNEIHTDSKRLEQILRNLLANAFKFTQKGQVHLKVAPASSGWSLDHPVLSKAKEVIAFSVIDTGIGIPVNKQKIIFEAFQQAESGTSRKYGGTGLGLSISRDLSILLGGQLTLANSEPGRGSTFILYVPKNYVPDKVVTAFIAPATEPELLVASNSMHHPDRRENDGILASPAKEVSGNGKKHAATAMLPEIKLKNNIDLTKPNNAFLIGRKVLVVDDDIRNIFAMTSLLEHQQMQVFSAESGREAIEQLEKTPDMEIVLMDIMMPEMDGYQTMEKIRQNRAYRRLPIIALTAKAMKGDREKCLEAGASDYLAKPVNTEQLLSALRMWLHR